MSHDVIVIGGSYAGMAAALQLLRARRDVLILDAGQRRNRAAGTAHGFLSRDGEDPAAIAASARVQLSAYPTLTWVEGAAVQVEGTRDDFTVTTAAGTAHRGRRVVLALGVSDQLPDLPGLADRWGTTVFHCPYCHGYELDRGRIGVIGTRDSSIHQAMMLPEWGEVTYVLNGQSDPTPQEQADLRARGVTLDRRRIAAVEGKADLRMQDGALLRFDGLFAAPLNAPATPLATAMALDLAETPFGTQIARNGMKETQTPGVFACGDVAMVPHSVSLAVGDGAMAGAMVHRSLLFPEA
ncbi:NAD(P)/FAD-dependent oxidoreductase [Pseudooceanicola aestuarii]|uniref:NAD(P)/FAD-dependent oxidoreductase n=1 Tax=Pseudooceanicola aestuarii TaxID=2697319 RepID=UPI0013D66325|nr:NAD(P)/FAD-dependent oxidoreductase [Pseudooceanicola aestuarii]